MPRDGVLPMRYETFEKLIALLGIDAAEEIARDYVAVRREHIARLRAELDTKNNPPKTPELS